MIFRSENKAARWVALFDLLGTKALITSGREHEVVHAYSEAMKRLTDRASDPFDLQPLWLSDTFILIGNDDSPSTFAAVESAARGFMTELIINHIPARGAIAVGSVYLDSAALVAVGPALLEALEYGDNQDWLGLIMCPSAVAGVKAMGLSFPRLNWTEHEIPWSPCRTPKDAPVHLPAYVLGVSGSVNGRNVCRDALTEMAGRSGSKQQSKYDRSIRFLDEHKRFLADG